MTGSIPPIRFPYKSPLVGSNNRQGAFFMQFYYTHNRVIK